MSTARFTVRSLFCLSLSLGAFATTTPAQADGRVMRGERGVDDGRFFAENYMEELCYLNANSGAGILSVHVWPMFAQVMVARYPGTFAYVGAEECGDSIDNDCDGVVDEDCAVVETFTDWFSGFNCDECMVNECADESSACLLDEQCKELIECPAWNSCVSDQLGLLGCVCGAGVSIRECMADAENNTLKGACVEGFSKIDGQTEVPLFLQYTRLETPLGKAGYAYICMGRKCRTQCASVFQAANRPVCGNGSIEEGEACDDGNTADGDGCSATCQVEPPAETWLAGADCDACMESECAPQESSCLGDADCKALIRCPAEKNCVSGTLGLLSCICGEGVSVTQCQVDDASNSLKGACVEDFSQYVGQTGDQTPLSQLVLVDTPMQKAGRAYTCMARKCKARCAENMFDVAAGPVCGNGVVEEGEQCDDGNQVEGDDCSNDCKSGAEPTWGEGSQGVQCDECMDRECKDTAESCLSDATCYGVAMCYAREACLDRNLGSVPCLCGPGVSPLECQQSNSVAGPCKDTILSALGMTSESLPAEVFTRFSMGATRPANSTGICMMRKCSTECSHNLAQ